MLSLATSQQLQGSEFLRGKVVNLSINLTQIYTQVISGGQKAYYLSGASCVLAALQTSQETVPASGSLLSILQKELPGGWGQLSQTQELATHYLNSLYLAISFFPVT